MQKKHGFTVKQICGGISETNGVNLTCAVRQFINQKASSSFPFVPLCMPRPSTPTAWMN